MTTQMTRRLRRAGAVLVLALASGLAVASDNTLSYSKTVPIGDLNLDSVQGVAVLYRRITDAAREVCASAFIPGSRLVSPAYAHCVARAVTDAIAQIGRPELGAQYARTEHHAS